MKIKTVGREMKEAECEFISLVPRGANQIPFRIIKSDTSQENTMSLDITNIQRLFKRESAAKAAVAPVVIGVCVRKGDNFDAIKTSLTEQGFTTDKLVEKADADLSIFLQGEYVEADMTDVSLVSLKGEDVMVAIKGFSPWTDKLVTFSDKVAAQGFYMSMDSAADVLEDTIFGIICDADAQKDMSASIGDACDQFKAYALGMVKALPAAAFKTERALKMAKCTNADPKDKSMQENGSQDPNVHQHGKDGEATTAVNQDVMPPMAKKSFSVVDPEELINALKIEDAVEREAAIKAVMLNAPVVQAEDGPGESGMDGKSSDMPVNYVSMISKAAKPAFEGAKPFKAKDAKKDMDGDDDASKAMVDAAKKGELPTESVDKPVDGGSNPVMEALKGQLSGITEMLVAMKADIDAVKTTQTEQSLKLVTVTEKSEALAVSLSGAVLGSASLSTEQATPDRSQKAARKSDGILDTAFGGKSVFGDR